MLKQTCLALLVLALIVTMSALASASNSNLGESSDLLRSVAPNPTPASESSSPAAIPVKEQEVRSKDSSVRLFNGRKGGKLLIFENQNNMVKVDLPKTQIDHAAVEEEAMKGHSEQNRKKEAEDRLEDEKEARVKNDRDQRDKQQMKMEQDAKKKQIEDAKEQAAEAERKAKLEDAAKAAEHQTAERQAQEQRAKRVEKEQEEDKKKQEEEAAKTRARQNEAKEKAQAEQAKKDAEFQIAGGWRNYGGGWAEVGVDVIKNLCFASGLLAGDSGQLGLLPPSCRPSQGRLIFTLHRSDQNSRVDVLPDGRVFHITGGSGGWISLSNLWFPISTERPLPLRNGWVNYGYGYRPTTVLKQDGLCVLSGLVRNGGWGEIATAPGDCVPDEPVIFSGNNHDQVSRVDVHGNLVLYNGGSRNHGWVNLDGIAYVPGNGGQDLSLAGGYTVYGSGWRAPRWTKIDKLCVLTGLVRSSSFPPLMATLPESCRPRSRLIFGCNVHVRNARVDVHPSGQIHYVNGRVYDWISLDCIKFVAA